jgi:glycosyltransferase involved in cell wall biosynthesis
LLLNALGDLHDGDVKYRKTPAVSVAMTVFNGERYLRRAVESVLTQDGVDLELVIVNDGSTDSTAAVLDSIEDGRVAVVHAPRIGRARSLNLAFATCRAELVTFVDADDLLLPGALRTTVAYLQGQQNIDVVGSAWLTLIDETDEILRHRRVPVSEDEIDGILRRHRMPFYWIGAAIRADTICRVGGFDERLIRGIDLDLFQRIAGIGKLAAVDQPIAHIRHHEGQYFRMQRGEISSIRHRCASQRILQQNTRDALGSQCWPAWRLIGSDAAQGARRRFVRALERFLPLFVRHMRERQGWQYPGKGVGGWAR